MQLLKLQEPESRRAGCEAHDELLFIIIHQTYELWFKQILHEIDSVRGIFSAAPVDEKLITVAVSRLQRVKEIQNILVSQVTVLETMSPIDFLDFRDFLYPASGFQSVQFRLVENKLGLPAETRMTYGSRGYCSYLHGPDVGEVTAAEKEASLYALIQAWLERTPFLEHVGGWTWWQHYREAVDKMLKGDEEGLLSNKSLSAEEKEAAKKDLAATRDHFDSLLDPAKYEAARKRGEKRLSYKALQAALLITLYNDEPILALPYRLLSTLLDIDENLTAWRHR
jgi:tryptophan 2,3-dioxygenase